MIYCLNLDLGAGRNIIVSSLGFGVFVWLLLSEPGFGDWEINTIEIYNDAIVIYNDIILFETASRCMVQGRNLNHKIFLGDCFLLRSSQFAIVEVLHQKSESEASINSWWSRVYTGRHYKWQIRGSKKYRYDFVLLHPCELSPRAVIANREERSGKQSQLLNKYLGSAD